MGVNLFLYLIGFLFIYCVWKVRILLISLGFRTCPELTKIAVSNWFVRLILSRCDREIIVQWFYNEHMVRMYTENRYLYYIPDNKKRAIMNNYRSLFGLADRN